MYRWFEYIWIRNPLTEILDAHTYLTSNGVCANKHGLYNDLGNGDNVSMNACIRSCDKLLACKGVSWNRNTCYMTSNVAEIDPAKDSQCLEKGFTYMI